MLSNYHGGSNSREIFQHLVGETITASFQADDGKVYVVLSTGDAVVFGSVGGGNPVYWKERREDVERVIEARRRQIERGLAELRDLPGVGL